MDQRPADLKSLEIQGPH